MLTESGKFRYAFIQTFGDAVSPAARRMLLGSAFFLLLIMILATDFLTDKVSLKAGQVSDRDVIAPRTLSYVNAGRTKRLEAEVLASVATVYDLDISVITRTEEHVTDIFRVVRTVLATSQDQQTKQSAIDKTLPVPLPGTTVRGFLELNVAQLAKAEDLTKSILRKYLQRGVREDEVDLARKQLVLEVEQEPDKRVEAVVAGISQTLLRPNFILNARETDKRKQIALAGMEAVRETVVKGQVLVHKGDLVTDEQIQIIDELGLYRGNINVLRILGLTAFILAVMVLMSVYLCRFANATYRNTRYMLLIGLIVAVTLLLSKTAHYYSDFAAPIAAGALLAAILFNVQIGVLVSVGLSLLFGIIADHDFRMISVALIGSMTGVYSVSQATHGYSLTRTGLRIAAVNILIIGATGWIGQIPHSQVVTEAALGAVNGVAAAVIAIGLLPYLESSFSIITPLKLLELVKPNHPLMQRLLLEAPGTYHHSILVGNLAETAADIIGADPVIARVGAYYHDIGKTKRPYFFVENQTDQENPHDKIAPSLSTLIVTSHIKDGLELCQEYKLPPIIHDIIQQHHGTTLVSYFYKRATVTEHGECVIEADFRYEGPRPRTKEAALVMLADACEAAVRSLGKPNINRIEVTVRKMIKERLHDGQLDDCKLTLKDLEVIGDVFIRVLSSMYHKRIEYPDTKEIERRKGKNGFCNK